VTSCPLCASKLAPKERLHVTDDMLARALGAYYAVGRLEDEADFQNAMREALAAALEIMP
jgi:hypothetical protein